MGGGAWKVAYADFVTAMMALFMVLWISSQDQEIILKTVEYFKDPFGVGFADSKSGSITSKTGENADKFELKQQIHAKTSMVDLAFLHKLANDYFKKLNLTEEVDAEKPVQVNVVPDGLSITIFAKNQQPLFEKGTSNLTEWGNYVVQNLAWLMDRNDMRIRINSHIPEGYEVTKPDSNCWDLTTERSNQIRKKLQSIALSPKRIYQVIGSAEASPIEGLDPKLPQNERVEISLMIE